MQQLTIPKPSNYSFSETLWFLDRNLDDCMHRVVDRSVFRLFPGKQKPALVSITEANQDLVVDVLSGKIGDEEALLQFIVQWLDLDRNILPFYKLLKKDQDLGVLAKKFKGFRMVGIPDLFECLCWCVMGQQINLDFAYKVKRRVVETFGQSLTHKGEKWFLFPSPEVLREVKIEDYRSMQLTTRKAEYLIGISELFRSGQLSKEKLLALKSEELMKQELMKIRGVGEWTANYTVMKSLRGMDCVPYGDSGINQALFDLKQIPKNYNRAQVDKVFDNFPGWRSYLVYYLWRSRRGKSLEH
jgi:DNA-3-methyladenine glycosylase II